MHASVVLLWDNIAAIQLSFAGAVVFLVDNWHIPGFDSLEDTPLKDRLKTLFAKEADLTSLSGFARVRATGFACIPLVDPSDDKHISGVMEELTSLLKVGGPVTVASHMGDCCIQTVRSP